MQNVESERKYKENMGFPQSAIRIIEMLKELWIVDGKSTSTIDRSPQRPNNEKEIPHSNPPQTPKLHIEWK